MGKGFTKGAEMSKLAGGLLAWHTLVESEAKFFLGGHTRDCGGVVVVVGVGGFPKITQ